MRPETRRVLFHSLTLRPELLRIHFHVSTTGYADSLKGVLCFDEHSFFFENIIPPCFIAV